MPLDRVQCGECLKLNITSFKEPLFRMGHCVRWRCRICGHQGHAIGRERLITKEAWEAEYDLHSGKTQGVG